MAGLVAYGSSDEEDETQEVIQTPPAKLQVAKKASDSDRYANGKATDTKINGHVVMGKIPESNAKDYSVAPDAPMVGPSLGPSGAVNSALSSPLPEDSELSAPQSPYSANRSLLRELTLPSVPNLDIPPSPPRSPPPSTNAKFAHFLKLKQQGVHFNDKIAKSSALKNPSLMQKLMDFADIDEEGQYESTLSDELWNPRSFPEWAYKEELAKSQQQILKKREAEKLHGQREAVDFVPASTSGELSQTGIPATGVRTGVKSTAERVMAGLERGRSNSPQMQAGVKRKSRFES